MAFLANVKHANTPYNFIIYYKKYRYRQTLYNKLRDIKYGFIK